MNRTDHSLFRHAIDQEHYSSQHAKYLVDRSRARYALAVLRELLAELEKSKKRGQHPPGRTENPDHA